jgi:type IV pilus assembly protein PilM
MNMRFPGSNKNKYLGVDIGSQTIKVCHLIQRPKGIFLNRLGLATLPSSAIVNGLIKEPLLIADRLKTLLNNLQISLKEIAFSISGYSVIIKKITLPALSEKELAMSIDYEAQQHIPFDIKEVNLDFQIMDSEGKHSDIMPVLLAAAKKETLNAYLEVFALAGLTPCVADVAAFALGNAYETKYRLDSSPVALINLGAGQITIHVLNEKGPIFTRDIFLGGRQVTDHIQSSLNLSFEEAEKIKLQGTKTPDQLDQIAPFFLSLIQTWMEEIKKVFDFLAASEPENRPERIFLSGGSSLIPGLPQVFSKGLGLPVELFNPFSQVMIDPETFDPSYLQNVGPQMAIAFGLALRQEGE